MLGLRTYSILIGGSMFSLIPFVMFIGPLLDEYNGHYEIEPQRKHLYTLSAMVWYGGFAMAVMISIFFDIRKAINELETNTNRG